MRQRLFDGQISLRVRTLLLAGATLAAWTPALAQDAAQDSNATPTPNETIKTVSDGSQQIIVTAKHYVPTSSMSATKTDIPLIETPQSVSVITRDQIDLLNFRDVQQAVRYSSGVIGESYGPDPRYDFLTVRGFTPKEYVDGLAAPISTTIYSVGLDLYGFQAIDILKGPSAVLYGNSPPGGLYNLTSRRPDSVFGGEAGLSYGNHEYYQANMTVTGPVSDSVSARFTGLYRDNHTQVDGVHARRIYAAPAVTWKLDGSTRITGLAYYQYDNIDNYYNGFLPVAGTLEDNPNGPVSIHTNLGEKGYNNFYRTQWGLGYDASHDFAPGISFHSNTKWFNYNEKSLDIYASGIEADNRTIDRANFPYNERVHEFATDNRFDAKITTGALQNHVIAGVDYRNVSNDADFGFSGAPSVDLYNPVNNVADVSTPPATIPYNHERLKQTGIYAQDQVKAGPVIATLSGRYDWADTLDRSSGETDKQHKFTYRAGLTYVTDVGIAPYVSYSTSFEPVLGTDGVTGDKFKPSSGKQWEGGLKFDGRQLGPDVKIFGTLAAFDIKQTNVVSVSPSITPVFGTQAGEVEVYGGEAEIVARIHEQLSINGSYTYTHSEVTKDTSGAQGAPLPTTPKHKASLLVDYTLQKGPLGGLGAGIGGRYVTNSAGALPGAYVPVVYYAGKATLFDAIIHYDLPGWRFAVNGSNIFNKKYVVRCAGITSCAYGQDRQVFASVTRKF